MSQLSITFDAAVEAESGATTPPGSQAPPGERVLIAPGPRAAEALLLREIAREVEAARANPRLLATPVRVIVPSRSLREHVAAKLAQAHGGLAGVLVQTLRGLCHELLRGEASLPQSGDALAPILVRRAAAREPTLAAQLAPLDDGFATVEATVRDLLDAGLDASSAEAALEALAGRAEAPDARAQAVVAVALAAVRELAALGLAPRSALFTQAAARVASGALSARAIWIHGYADVTGVQLDVLEALVREAGARVVLDHPPDPTQPGAAALDAPFTERLRLRLGGGTAAVAPRLPEPELALLRASGSHAEARAVAEQIRSALDAGSVPESIAIVARDLTPLRFALSTHLRRLAIPFSGGAGFLGPAGRRIQALLAWLELGPRTPTDRWLEARANLRGADDLRVAFHGIGAGRIAAVAELDLRVLLGDADEYALPVRRSLGTAVAEGETGGPSAGAEDSDAQDEAREIAREVAATRVKAVRRRVKRAALEAGCAAANRAIEMHERLRAPLPLRAALRTLLEFADEELGWRWDTPGRSELLAACAQLEESSPAEFVLDGSELRVLLRRALRAAGVAPLGGWGGGVRVLSVTEARARTFERLFVIGANRDVFPRPFQEDVLLSDAQRGRLEAVLPDIPIKRRAIDEDRYLFAQLANAAPWVQVSWQGISDDGKERPASPLVERLGRPASAIATARPAWEPGGARGPRPAHEHAVTARLAGAHAAAERAAQLALGDSGVRVAAARRATLVALDTPPAGAPLGPYFGFVGEGADWRTLSVSRLEGAVRCGWQVFLEHVLCLEPPVDALAALPELTGLMLGNTVHGALEAIVGSAGVKSELSLAQALAHEAVAVPWPRDADAARILLEVATRVARQEGVVLPGFAQLLARRARAVLERVRQVDWPSDLRSAVVGAEVKGERTIEGGGVPIVISFRADRVDRVDGALELTDYKTGAPFTRAASAAAREEMLRKRVAAGMLLQAAAYALAVGEAGRGRYVYARSELEPELSEVAVRADGELAAAFDNAVITVASAWRAGAFVPRLAKHDTIEEGDACRSCRVAESCLRGDTGARLRLARWRDAGAQPGERPAVAAARALLALGKTTR